MAGLGSRLGFNTTKGLIKIGKKRIIDYQLSLLDDIPDIRIVVGFQEYDVMNHVKKIRDDITFVRNPDFRTTSNSYSIYLASKDLKDPYLIIDGDILINKNDFNNFLSNCNKESIVGLTQSKTEEAVFVSIDENKELIKEFQRSPKLKYEWTGIAYLNGIFIDKNQGYVYKELEKNLPLKYNILDCYEIDTESDFNLAKKNLHKLNL
jgi:choline kinase